MLRILPARWAQGMMTLAACAALTMPGPVPAQTLTQPATKQAEPPKPKALVVSPAAAPVPALKYRLLPSSADLNPGDAAPIYLRAHGYDDSPLEEAWRQIGEKSERWQELPLREFPAIEVHGFVNLFSGKLKQIEFGTRRKTCDWNYTLPEERLNAIAILLPDIQTMRQWGRLLALKARVEIAEGKYDEAIQTLETGLAFARHVAEGPFLINGRVGIAIANLVLAPCDELIAQPGSPNLYWALTALPRPLVSLRNALEVEPKLSENMIPELTAIEQDQPLTAAEWASLLWRVHERIVKWCRYLINSDEGTPGLQVLLGWDLAQFKAEALPAAREYLKTSRKLTDQQLAAMSDDQIVALYLAGAHRALHDDLFKVGYLPVRDALPQLAAVEERLKATKPGPLALFTGIQPTIRPALMAELRLDRQVAALRVIEAVRMYAAAHDGALPETLNQITQVPVPDDPATGKPFEYHSTANSALLSGSTSALPPAYNSSYRIAIRH